MLVTVLPCPQTLADVIVWPGYADAARWATPACLASGTLADIIVKDGGVLELPPGEIATGNVIIEAGGELRQGAPGTSNAVLATGVDVRGRVVLLGARTEIQSSGNVTFAQGSSVDATRVVATHVTAADVLALHGRVATGREVRLRAGRRLVVAPQAEVTAVSLDADVIDCPIVGLLCSPRAGGTTAGAGGGEPATVGRFGDVWNPGTTFGGSARVPVGSVAERHAGLGGGKLWVEAPSVVVQGTLSANGVDGADVAPGGAPGDSVEPGQSVGGGGGGWVVIDGVSVEFAHGARVSANGGSGGSGATLSTHAGGGGGGGYVAVIATHVAAVTDIMQLATIRASGGKAW